MSKSLRLAAFISAQSPRDAKRREGQECSLLFDWLDAGWHNSPPLRDVLTNTSLTKHLHTGHHAPQRGPIILSPCLPAATAAWKGKAQLPTATHPSVVALASLCGASPLARHKHASQSRGPRQEARPGPVPSWFKHSKGSALSRHSSSCRIRGTTTAAATTTASSTTSQLHHRHHRRPHPKSKRPPERRLLLPLPQPLLHLQPTTARQSSAARPFYPKLYLGGR